MRLKRSVSVSGNNWKYIASRIIIFLNWWAEHDVSILSIIVTDDTDLFCLVSSWLARRGLFQFSIISFFNLWAAKRNKNRTPPNFIYMRAICKTCLIASIGLGPHKMILNLILILRHKPQLIQSNLINWPAV